MPRYEDDWERLRKGQWVSVYQSYQGQTDEELAAGADAYYIDRYRIVSVEADNVVKAVRRGSPKGTYPTTLARGHHHISTEKP